MNWTITKTTGQRGATHTSECGRFVIAPIGNSGRFSLVVKDALDETLGTVFVRGVSVAKCKIMAEQIMEEEKEPMSDRGFSFNEMLSAIGIEPIAMTDEDAKEMDAILKTETMPSAERHMKGNENVKFGKTTTVDTKLD